MKKIYSLLTFPLHYVILFGCTPDHKNSGNDNSSQKHPTVALSGTKESMESLETKIAQLSKSLDTQKEDWTGVKNQLEGLKKLSQIDLDDILGKIGASSSQFATLSGQFSEQEKRLGKLETDPLKLSQADLDTLKQQFGENLVQEIENRLQSLTQQIATLESKPCELTQEDIQNQSNILRTELEKKLAEETKTLQTQIEELKKTKLTEKPSVSTQTDTTLGEIQGKIVEIEKWQQASGIIDALQEQVQNLGKELGDKLTQESLNGITGEIDKLENKLTQEIINEIKTLKTDVGNKLTEENLVGIRAQLTEFKKWKETFNQANGIVTRIEQLENQFNNLIINPSGLTKKELEIIRKQIKDHTEQLGKTVTQEILNNRVGELENRLTNEAIKEIENLKTELESKLNQKAIDKLLEPLSEQITKLKERLRSVFSEGSIEDIRSQIEHLRKRLDGDIDKGGEQPSFEGLKALFDSLSKRLNGDFTTEKPRIEDIRSRIVNLEKRLNGDFTTEKPRIENIRSRIVDLEKRLDGDFTTEKPPFEGIRSRIIDLEKRLDGGNFDKSIEQQLEDIKNRLGKVDLYKIENEVGRKLTNEQLRILGESEKELRDIEGVLTQDKVKYFQEKLNGAGLDVFSWNFEKENLTSEQLRNTLILKTLDCNGLWGEIVKLKSKYDCLSRCINFDVMPRIDYILGIQDPQQPITSANDHDEIDKKQNLNSTE